MSDNSPLRQRMIEDMSVRNFVEKTRNDYIRHVKTFTAFLGRSPETATPEDLRRFQLHQTQTGVRPPTINGSVVALRFSDCGCLRGALFPYRRNLLLAHQTARHLAFQATDLPMDWNLI